MTIWSGWLFGLQLGHRTKALTEPKIVGGGVGLPPPVPSVCLHRFQLLSSLGGPRMICSSPISFQFCNFREQAIAQKKALMLLHPWRALAAPQRVARQCAPQISQARTSHLPQLPMLLPSPQFLHRTSDWTGAPKPCHSLCAELCFTAILPPPLRQVPAARVSALILPRFPFAAPPENQGRQPWLGFALRQ